MLVYPVTLDVGRATHLIGVYATEAAAKAGAEAAWPVWTDGLARPAWVVTVEGEPCLRAGRYYLTVDEVVLQGA